MFTRARAGPRRPARPRLSVQPLEGRDVPAAPLATFPGTVDAPHQPDWVQMQVDTASDRVLLAFETTPADGSALVPGSLRVYAGPGAQGAARGTVEPGFALKAVSRGAFFARVAGASGSTGGFDVSVKLAGDVTGDQQVDNTDVDAIRGLAGRREGQDGFDAAADVNHNGIIGPGDLRLARWNLGRTAAVGPMTAEAFLFASSDVLQHGPRFAQFNPKTMPGISLVINGINDSATPIQVDTFGWTVQLNPGGFPIKTDLRVTAPTGADSPLLFKAVTLGTAFADATLFAGRIGTGSSAKPKLEWDLNTVGVSSYSINGNQGNGTHLEDAFSLIFSKLRVTYTPTLPNGRPGDPVSAGFDFATGQGF
jgi:type VI protein secretion system component Hcp